VLLPFNDILQMQLLCLAVELHVQTPTRRLVDVGAINWLFVAFHPMKSCLWILPGLVTSIVLVVRQDLVAFVNDPVFIEQHFDFSHYLALPVRGRIQCHSGRVIERAP